MVYILSIEESDNRYDHVGLLEIATVNSVMF
jgi:hypothetical protein